MRILILGGSGRSGSDEVRHLFASDLVSEVGIAGRNLDTLNRVVTEIGSKARAVQVDILDERRLASVAAKVCASGFLSTYLQRQSSALSAWL